MEIRGNLTQQLDARMKLVARAALERVAAFLVPQLIEVLSVVNPGQRTAYKTKRTASGRRATHTVYGTPSQPGEPPRQRTGWGKGHVGYQIREDARGLVLRVGVPGSAIYLGYHEAGISYRVVGKQQRPWLAVTAKRYKDVIDALIKSALREGT